MTTQPGHYDFTIYKGATFSEVITWKDQNNANINLTGYTARMMARSQVGAATPFLTLTTENGGISLGGSAGTITLTALAASTAALTATDGVYDLELIAAGGAVTRLLQGHLYLVSEVTR